MARPVTRAHAKSLQNLDKTSAIDNESDRVYSESDLNETVRHIDANLLEDDQNRRTKCSNISKDSIKNMVCEVVQNQVVGLMAHLEQSMFARMEEAFLQLGLQKHVDDKNSKENIKNETKFDNDRHSRNFNKPLDMHRWNVCFSGDEKELRVDDFVRRVEHIAFSQGVPLQEVANNLYMLLKAQAANWYFQWVQRNQNISWNSLKSALVVQFRSFESDYDLEHRIMNRLQKSGESFDQFYNVIVDLNSRMSRPRSDRDLIEIMKRNISSRMLIFIHNSVTQTLPEFLLECRRAEKNVVRIETGLNKLTFKPKVCEIEATEEDSPDFVNSNEEFVEAITRVKSEKNISDITCFDCKEKGHFAFDCTKKSGRVFCYKCGRDNYIISNCPFCAEGNFKKNRKPGDSVQ